MKKTFIILIVLLVVLTGIWFGLRFLIGGEEPVACTQDVKLCPDGSYVGRVGPNCEFALCPDAPQWPAIKQAIANCEVESVWQTHARTVWAKLKNGEELTAVEPELNDIIDLAIAAEPKCGKILMGTE
ncbi:MAG TPA: hypothetical protein VMW21_00490 [Patescibacteria group bacterium]|nr:hypothetical protein [Patescibacteria group bacterium]